MVATYPGGNVRLILKVRPEVVRALKVRAATEGTTMAQLLTDWVQTWAKLPRPRRGSAP